MTTETHAELDESITRSHHHSRGSTVARPEDRHDPTGAVVLTWEGRRIFAAKWRNLRDDIIPNLLERQESEHPGEVDYLDHDYQRAVGQLSHVCRVLAQARAVESTPDDPRVVELGEAVTLFLEDGTLERRLIVHPLEAPLGGRRVSSSSPLGRALLGRRIGEEVEVRAPTGPYRCRIIRAERLRGARYARWTRAVSDVDAHILTPSKPGSAEGQRGI